MPMLWKIMIGVGVFLILATFTALIWVILHIPKTQSQWVVEAIKYRGPGQHIEEGWEPFCFDPKANVLFIRRELKEGGE
ncbi:MAG: hypothetical protein ACXAEN_20285 [Candidatus Thorarchaeota archaeon]|jgi:hypothetical protein